MKKYKRMLAALLLVLTVGIFSACQQNAAPPNPNPAPQPDFTISLGSGQLDVLQWDSSQLSVTVTPKNGFTGTVNLALASAPAGVTISPSQIEVPGSDPVSATVTVSAAEDAAPGEYSAGVKAVSGSLVKTANLGLNVLQLPKNWSVSSFPLYGVAASDDGQTVVAVGDGGLVLVSTDGGTTWTRHSVGEAVPLEAVAYGNGSFVAVGGGDAVFVSADGSSWSAYSLGQQTYELEGIAYGDHGFVAAGSGYALSSSNGTSWTAHDLSSVISNIHDVAFGGGKYVLVGRNASDSQGAIYSTSTSDFSSGDEYLTGVNRDILSVTYDGSQFVALSFNNQYVSSNGVSWTHSGRGSAIADLGVAYGGGKYVAVGCCGWLDTSNDASSWSHDTLELSNDPEVRAGDIFHVIYTGSRFVAVGEGSQIAISDDGSNWTFPVVKVPVDVGGMTFDGQRFLIVGGSSGRVFASNDGSEWQPWGNDNHTLSDIDYDGTKYVAVGNTYIDYSRDGRSWTRGFTTNGGVDVGAVAHGGGKFVAVGDSGSIFESSDHGQSWSQASSPTTKKLSDIAYGNGTFVAVGWDGTIVYKSGGGWQEASSGSTNTINGVAFGHGRFVAVGEPNTMLVSEDGRNWQSLSVVHSGYAYLYDVIYGRRGFVAVGWASTTKAFYSPDGERWRSVEIPAVNLTPYSLGAGGGHYLAGGMNGQLVRAP